MSEEAKKKGFNYGALRRIFTFVRPYRFQFYGSIAMAIVLAIFAPIRPYLIQLTIDKATGKTSPLPEWLRLFLFHTNFNSVEQVIVAITIFQVGFYFY